VDERESNQIRQGVTLNHSIRWIRTVKVIIVLTLLIFGYEVAVLLYPPVFVLGLALIGRSPLCPPSQAFKGAQSFLFFRERVNPISKGSRLVEKDPANFHLWQTPRGRFWIPAGSDGVLPILLAQQESKVYGGNQEVDVHAGDIVLDCGAHIGVYTREALSLGARLVVAIEPAPENLECLRRNFADEISKHRVVVYPKGVWDKEDFLTLYTNPGNSSGDSFLLRTQAASEVQKVPLTTIDIIVNELKLEKVDFVKMDIEGAPDRAIEGASNTLTKFKPRLAISTEEETDDPQKIAALVFRHRSDYRILCGQCAVKSNYVDPAVLFFF
jgi:FkbM family methyltransferase